MFSKKKVIIKGAGDLATGVAARLWRSGSYPNIYVTLGFIDFLYLDR